MLVETDRVRSFSPVPVFWFVPSFMAHRENVRINQTAMVAESIRIAFKAYAENNLYMATPFAFGIALGQLHGNTISNRQLNN